MKNIAVILAGGTGRRIGEQVPKQFIRIAGKYVIEHTISVFQNHPLIDEICVVSHPDYIRKVSDIRENNNFSKISKIIPGGSERYGSSLAAINVFEGLDDDVNLIFHDAVRPFVSSRIIDDVINALKKYDAVDVAIPATDTIIKVAPDDTISEIPSRKYLWNGQTPQAFKLSVIKEAYQRGLLDEGFTTTDDCGVVLKYMPEVKVHVVSGEASNMKLTYKEDIFLIDKLFQLKSIVCSVRDFSHSEQMSLRGKVIVIYGGTQGIGEALAELCRAQAMNVVVFSRRIGVDITDLSQVRQSMHDVYMKYHRIDFVVNTVGVFDKLPLCDMDDNTIMHSVTTNYLGCVNVAKCAYDYLGASKGMLLFYASSSYTRGRGGYSIYSSLKAAIVNLAQALSEEWIDNGVKVNCMNPERTKTPMRIRNFGTEPADTLLTPRQVAVASLRTLLSNVTGEVVDVRLSEVL